MYARIRKRPSLHRAYGDALVSEGLITAEKFESLEGAVSQELEAAYTRIHDSECAFPQDRFFDNWQGYHGRFDAGGVKTAVADQTLIALSEALTRIPEGFALNPKLVRLAERRHEAVAEGKGIDWANAESLAFASLLREGYPIRLSGQDCARGTFSQRHSVWTDMESGAAHTPLNRLGGDQAAYEVHNSLLAEYSVLGFEYGYALMRPEVLTIWEAQFGDFANNAQSIIDLFIASGEAKWQRLNGLVMLLPHGFEGQGPEHSSARLERFLQLCALDNLQVCYPSTPAQYFHLLRRQMHLACRKPLVVMTPKSILRHPLAVSTRAELSVGAFAPVLAEKKDTGRVRRVVFCSGKLYYDLMQRRQSIGRRDLALVRVEQLYPFPEQALKESLKPFSKANDWHWVQEEPENMGAWTFMRPRLEALIGRPPGYIGRPAAASPATGFPQIYRRQQDAIIDEAVGTAEADRSASAAAN
jgi:2-oxoglutarate dehydrogenase E1 component